MRHGDCKSYCKACEAEERYARQLQGAAAVPVPVQAALLDVAFDARPARILKPEHPPGEEDEFYTPRRYFDPWNREFEFTVDCCATKESAKLPRFYTMAEDGLRQNYVGEFPWMNMPYSDIERWIALADYWMRNGALGWMGLPPANRTEQPWWQKYVERFRDLDPDRVRSAGIVIAAPLRPFTLETRFIEGRIKFGFPGDPEGLTSEGGKFASVGLIWRAVR